MFPNLKNTSCQQWSQQSCHSQPRGHTLERRLPLATGNTSELVTNIPPDCTHSTKALMRTKASPANCLGTLGIFHSHTSSGVTRAEGDRREPCTVLDWGRGTEKTGWTQKGISS